MWTVYTDGACVPNPGQAGWGAVAIDPTGNKQFANGKIGYGTNQIAEITAAIEGLLLVPAGAEVLLVSDSQYTLKGLTEWRAGWIRRNWLNASKEPVANRALWERLFAVADQRRVKTQWVKGHNGDPSNEKADELAKAAVNGAPVSEKAAKADPVGALTAALQVLDRLAPAEAGRIRLQFQLA